MSALAAGLAMAAPKVIKGIGKAFTKTPELEVSNDTTAYLNKLRNISKKGMYGQDVQNEANTAISQQSQDTRTALRSNTVRQGIENSGVLAEQLIKEGGNTTLKAARIAKQIARMNEESKISASEKAASVSQQINAIKYQNAMEKYKKKMDTIDTLAGAFEDGVSGYKGESDSEMINYLLSK